MKTNTNYISRILRSLLSLFLLSAVLNSYAYAAWSTDPAVNNTVSSAAGDQWSTQSASDGSGGAIIVWEDNRNGNT